MIRSCPVGKITSEDILDALVGKIKDEFYPIFPTKNKERR